MSAGAHTSTAEIVGRDSIVRDLEQLRQGAKARDAESEGEGPVIEFGRHVASLPREERPSAWQNAKRVETLNLPDEEVSDDLDLIERTVFDFDAPAPEPRWVVQRMFERQTVNLASGDTGSAKSFMLSHALPVAAVTGADWLGRNVTARRVLVVDEENPWRVAFARLRALGLKDASAAERDALYYMNRQGIMLGEGDWIARLHATAAAHRADLILVDTTSAATLASVNDPDEVTRLYAELRPMAADLDAAVVLLHHERKQGLGLKRTVAAAALGVRHWSTQADTHLELREEVGVEYTPLENGGREGRSQFVMSLPITRDGEPAHPERIVLETEKNAADALISAHVRSEGRIVPEATIESLLASEIIDAAEGRDGEVKTAELAEAVGRDANEERSSAPSRRRKPAVLYGSSVASTPSRTGVKMAARSTFSANGQRPAMYTFGRMAGTDSPAEGLHPQPGADPAPGWVLRGGRGASGHDSGQPLGRNFPPFHAGNGVLRPDSGQRTASRSGGQAMPTRAAPKERAPGARSPPALLEALKA
jgi:AAA domain